MHRRLTAFACVVLAIACLSATTTAARAATAGFVSESVSSPGGIGGSQLSSISCPAADDCWATVKYSQTYQTTPTVAHWNGSAWRLVTTPIHASDLDCTSISSCWAVGGYAGTGIAAPVIEHWDGSSWLQVPAPIAAPATFARIACADDTHCWAIGHSDTGTPIILSSAGTTWTVASTDALYPKDVVSDIVCSSPRSCVVVGSTTHGALILRWNGWRWLRGLVGSSSDDLSAVDCTASNACVAAGFAGSANPMILSTVWNGSAWSAMSRSSVAGQPTSLSCASSTSCWATNGSQAAHWDGSTWQIPSQPAPPPSSSGFRRGNLAGVGCSPIAQASEECQFVGGYVANTNGPPTTGGLVYAPWVEGFTG